MHRIPCPFCGVRDEVEFRYRGDASVARPAADAPREAFADYVFTRANPRGWQVEWWQHVHGCRRVLKVVRHTATHAIAWVGPPEADAHVPTADVP
jgi:sarcosine oxidase subunit delta